MREDQAGIDVLSDHINQLCANGRKPGSAGYKKTQEYICDVIASTGNSVCTQTFFAMPFGQCKNFYTETGPTDIATPRIVVGAHYDTLGKSGPGADDNASAVAVVLSLIERAPKDIPMTFVLFDYEEMFGYGALKGSRAFTAQYDKPIEKAVILDLVGGSLMPGFEDVYFQFGQALAPLEQNHLDFFHLPILFVEPVGSCLPRSDYGRFRSKGIPFTFVSSGTPWYYHTTNDVPENLKLEKMARLADCLAAEFEAPRMNLQIPTWARFREFVLKIQAHPAFDDPYFHKLAQLNDGPTRLQMMRMYSRVLPVLKKLGPNIYM